MAVVTVEAATRGVASEARAFIEGSARAIACGVATAFPAVLEAAAPNLCPVIDGAGIVVHSGCGANVDTVIVDGRVVLEHRCATLLDGDEVIKSAQAVANRLWQKSGYRPVLISC